MEQEIDWIEVDFRGSLKRVQTESDIKIVPILSGFRVIEESTGRIFFDYNAAYVIEVKYKYDYD